MSVGMMAALSGIQAGGKMLNVGAQNIANAQTDGYKKIRFLPVESSGDGVTVVLNTEERPEPHIISNEGIWEGSHVSVSEEIISHLQAAHFLEAQIVSVKVQDKVLGSLLDMTA